MISNQSSRTASSCSNCEKVSDGVFTRYRNFLLSPGTIVTLINTILLITGFVIEWIGNQYAANGFFLASALIGGAPIFVLAASNILREFNLTAGVMVSIAMIAAVVVGEFSAAALVAFMMLVGEMLENFTIARADNALNELENLVPNFVTIRLDKEDVTIPIGHVKGGDLVLVRPGGRIPVDGVIKSGDAAIDQSCITGESIPVDKGIGDHVFAGTLCTDGALEIMVVKIGENTTLGNMITLVKEAKRTQSPVQRVANRYAQFLTPMAIVVAIATYFLTSDVLRAITVLIVICPCSLVLATPTAVVAAIGNAAKHGVLVKNGTAMEGIGKVDVVAFDKTGTMTLGRPILKETIALDEFEPTTILRLAASVERSSEHPLGKAIVLAARERNLELHHPHEFQTMPGHGVRAIVDGLEVAIGVRMLQEIGVVMDVIAQEITSQLECQGNTVIPVAIEKEVSGLLVISDLIRAESREAMCNLKDLDIKERVLISGDNARVSETVGEELVVTRVYADTLPKQKLDLIYEMQNDDLKVAYVGDGVNDAPALAASDVGIAMGDIGTNIAIETADIVLLTDKIDRIPYLIDLSRDSLVVIRNNVIFSMSMNVLSVLLSIFGVIGPVIGAVMHEVSALPVVANSARLIGRKARFLSEQGAAR